VIFRPVSNIENPNRPADRISLRCPACRRDVTFDSLGLPDVKMHVREPAFLDLLAGQRRCGNPECRAHLFVIRGNYGPEPIRVTYPPETIDFDASDIPDRIVDAFEEAIKCHSRQCFVAAAIMVRKTLEEVCADRKATGGNLKAKIEALGDKVVLPQPMLDALDDLRLLGNDAAHLEARVYEEIGQEELEVAIDVAKEILKATYQYEGLMSRLRALRKADTDAT
jgi:hypothetical protein